MSEIVIKVEKLSKDYRLGAIGTTTLSDDLKRLWARIKKKEDPTSIVSASSKTQNDIKQFWALNDVNFEIKKGEVLGIIGKNGAGKSTLLKILSRVTAPSSGSFKVKGRIASLLEVGTGMHPELTGRENIFLNGAILGMTKNEIKAKFDEIVAFSGISQFIDTPVKRYSSGMKVRLGFAVAAHLNPEILIVDEVLAVGDAEFQKRCIGKMKDVAGEGRTVIFVSHSMGSIAELCTRGILMQNGQIINDGNVEKVIYAYLQLNAIQSKTDLVTVQNQIAYFSNAKIVDDSGIERGSFDINENINIKLDYILNKNSNEITVGVAIRREIYDVFNSFDCDDLSNFIERDSGKYESTIKIPKMFLKAGNYSIDLTLREGISTRTIQVLEAAINFNIEEGTFDLKYKGYRKERSGHIIFPGEWITLKKE